MDERTAQLLIMGSAPVNQSIPSIAAGVTVTYDLDYEFPGIGYVYDFMDSVVVTNNSAQPITFKPNPGAAYPILAYGSQEITPTHLKHGYSVENTGSGATNDGEVTIAMRRMPVNSKLVTVTKQ